MNLVLLTKKHRPECSRAAELCLAAFPDAKILRFNEPEPARAELGWLDCDYLISFLCPFVVPSFSLARAKVDALNFHPGPPEWPGIGCANQAVYAGAKDYGVTMHRMSAKPDTGDILNVERFTIWPGESVASLTRRCYDRLLVMLDDALGLMREGVDFGPGLGHWPRQAFTRAELEALCQVTPAMASHEVASRVRATSYPGRPGAWVEIGGIRFYAKEEK